jgi:putative transposase
MPEPGAGTLDRILPGCPFTSREFTGLLKDHGIQISMDGQGCWRDNVFVERLWKHVTYEAVSLRAYECVSDAGRE